MVDNYVLSVVELTKCDAERDWYKARLDAALADRQAAAALEEKGRRLRVVYFVVGFVAGALVVGGAVGVAAYAMRS